MKTIAPFRIVIVTISYRDFAQARSMDALLADRFQKAGIPLGPMLWTACPWDFTQEERTAMWEKEMKRAGVISKKKLHREADQMIELHFEVKS